MSVGDINNDGLRDIVASSADQNSVVWFKNNGGGGAWSMPITVAQNFDARQINCADMDGDGNQDVVGVSYESGAVVWWRNTNSGNTWAINYIDGALLGGYACDVGDFNGDGHPDVAAVSFSTGKVVAYFSQNPWGFSWAQHEGGNLHGRQGSCTCRCQRRRQARHRCGKRFRERKPSLVQSPSAAPPGQ
ncbi:MAG: VCBS repeat-containing protein [Desulfobacterales bacterium]|nr:VCBS repeat-containing protein [Desulfobacterales bacterium]